MKNLERFAKTINFETVDRLMTYEVMDNVEILKEYGGFDPSKKYSFEELVETNARALKNIGINITRNIYDPVNHWMGAKISNWVRFFGADPDNWAVSQAGDTAWISKRPFSSLSELEKNMPNLPKFEDVREWYEPVITYIREVFDSYDLVFIGGVEGPICDAYTYTDTELFCTAIYDAPELVSHIMDCTGKFSSYITQVFAENSSAPLMFMGEDIAGKTGPIFSPDFVRAEGLPRWKWITGPLEEKGIKFMFHTDGRYGSMLPVILEELDADGLNPIERNGCNDIFEIRDLYPNKFLAGNVCCATTLPFGTIGDIEDETLELIERIGPSGGILIGSSSEVNDLVPPENAAKMYETVLEYGEYPIDIERIKKRRAEIAGGLKLRKELIP
ncbi:uroporphyrinogen decarboxylase family protein [Candidatus Latescibacterota bacterium]